MLTIFVILFVNTVLKSVHPFWETLHCVLELLILENIQGFLLQNLSSL